MRLYIAYNYSPNEVSYERGSMERPMFDHLAEADSAMHDENKRISVSLISKAQDQIEQSLFVLGFVAMLAVWMPR